ncbi:MAG: hypothetical protein EXR81_03870 [Gammaproteobacteria bacterium]|nr:hypothetical protein [Gammaproteobacteria bacterium]
MNDRVNSPPSFKELRIRKTLDASSNALFSKSIGDQATPEVEIHLCDHVNQPYYKLVLNEVLFTHHHLHAYEGMIPFESLKLNYAKLQQTYIQKDHTGKIVTSDHAGYDLAKTQKL